MRKNRNLKKSFLSATIIASMVHTQTMAATSANDVGQAISIIGGVGQSILSQKQQIVMQQQAQIQAINIQKQLQPKLAVSKYFPECKLPQAMAAMPQNVCQGTNNATQLQSLYSYEAAASNMVNYFDQMLNDVASTSNGIGVSCMNNSKKNLDSQLTEMINNITRLQSVLKEESQKFRDANKPIIAQLEDTNYELNGGSDRGSSQNSLKTKTMDFTKLVSSTCQKVLGTGFASTAESNGFNGLLQSVAPKNQAANNFLNSKSQMETEIKNSVSKLKDSISSSGLEYWTSQDASGYGRGQVDLSDKLSSYPQLATIMQKERASLLSQVSRISKDLKKYNYDIQTMDKDLSSTLSSDISSVESDLKKKYLNSCTVDSSKGIAIDIDKVIGSVEQPSTNNSPMAVTGYKTALRNIMESDDDMTTKLANIKKLESQYQGIIVNYVSATGMKTTETPYQLMNKTYSNCNNKYTSDVESDTKKVKSLLTEYKSLTDSFSSNLGTKIVDTMINCNGESLKSTDSCNENTLNPASQQNFCIAKASSCASNMNSCYSEINSAVETRKAKMTNLSKQFNANVTTMVNRANALYKSQASNVEQLVKLVQARFPGSNFEIPKDMFISSPETSKDKYGIDVAMNGDINKIIEELPAKMETLKEMFANQKQTADQQMEEYIAQQKSNIQNEKSRFQSLQKQCAQAAESSSQAIAKANEAGQKAQNELDSKVKSFCRKYDNLRSSPVPSCDSAKKLADDIDGVSSRITQQTANLAQSYATTCDQYNNETSTYLEKCDPDTLKDATKGYKDECKRLAKKAGNSEQASSGGSSKSSKKKSVDKLESYCPKSTTSDEDFITNVIKKLNDSDKEAVSKVAMNNSKEYISSTKVLNLLKDGNASELGSDDSFFGRFASEYGDVISSGKICENLTKKNSSSAQPPTKSEDQKKADQAVKDLEDKAIAGKADADKEAALKALKDSKEYKDALAAQKTANAQIQAAPKSEDIGVKLGSFIKHTGLEDSEDDGDSSPKDAKTLAFQKLGEQASGSCDSESTASNSVGKNPLFFDINSYDKKVLGGVSK